MVAIRYSISHSSACFINVMIALDFCQNNGYNDNYFPQSLLKEMVFIIDLAPISVQLDPEA